MDRTRAWLAVAPLLAAGVLLAHGSAYRLTGTPGGTAHAYLEHAPQVLIALALVGVALGALTRRRREPPLWAFPLAAFGAFAAQEHVEALAHTGQLPFLLDSPAFLLGLLLQVPFAAGAWLLARFLLGSLEEWRPRRPRLARAPHLIPARPLWRARPACGAPLPARGPPSLLRR